MLLKNRKLISEILESNYLNKEVIVFGIIISIRIMKTKTFIDIKDKSFATIQIVINEKKNAYKGNFVLCKGIVQKQNEKNEILSNSIDIYGFDEPSFTEFSEETKLSHRASYIKFNMLENLKQKSCFLNFISTFFEKEEFLNINTPILSFNPRSGAESFVVNGKKKKYFLPQSPQSYKQYLISAGVEKYFQIASCFRDEEQRNDRQFEFLQLDLECVLFKKNSLMQLLEKFISSYLNIYKKEMYFSFQTITYKESIELYGTDAPFIFKDMKIKEENKSFYFIIDKDIINNKNIDLILKEFNIELKNLEISYIYSNYKYIFNSKKDASIGLKTFLMQSYINTNLIPLVFVWVIDFPLFCQEDNELTFSHNPFVSPKISEIDSFLSGNNDILSEQFDLCLNGIEILGGGERIYSKDLQLEIFKRLKLDISCPLFYQSVPPHCGAALGIERFLCIIYKKKSLREFIAFPKTQNGFCMVFDKK